MTMKQPGVNYGRFPPAARARFSQGRVYWERRLLELAAAAGMPKPDRATLEQAAYRMASGRRKRGHTSKAAMQLLHKLALSLVAERDAQQTQRPISADRPTL